MSSKKFGTVDEYLADLPAAGRKVIQELRGALVSAHPEFKECISYNIPTFKLDGKAMIYLAAWKNHYSIYPVTEATLAKLETHEFSFEWEKGTLRFSYADPPPTELVLQLADLRSRREVPVS